MATRDITIRIRAEVGAFKKDMDAAAAKAKETAQKTEASGKTAESGIGRLAQTAKAHEKAWSQVSTGMIAGGAAVVGGLTVATRAAMSWESAWTGVLKTVDGTPQQLGRVEDGLRGLARTLPSTHTEIAAVAEAAGQLGIQTDNVVAFTKTMIDLGESTNLTAEQGAMEMSRFMNIMGTSQSEVGRLGATIVGLGNNFAATESEIMAMSMRLAAAGKLAGLSEGQVMGLATSMSAVGIEAEAGGTAMTQVLTKIGKAVDGGGEKLDVFAKTAGMTSEQFQQAWKQDASGALDTLLKGLGEVEAGGQSMNAVLDEMGIKGIRESLAMKNLALASAGVGEAMTLGAEEYAKGTALIEEANKRYETAESKVKIAWNNITDAAIDAGAVLLPVVAGIAEAVADLASWFGQLPAPVQSAMTLLAGIAGVTALAGGAFMKLVPNIATTVGGMRALKADMPKTAAAIGGVGKALGIAAVGVGAFTAAVALHNRNLEAAKGPGHYALELQRIGAEAATVDDIFKNLDFGQSTAFEDRIHGIGDALKELNRGGLDHFGADMGARNHIAILRENVEGLDQALAIAASSGHAEDAAKAWEQITAAADDQGMSVEKLESLFPAYVDALNQAEAAANGAEGGLDALAGGYTKLTGEIDKAIQRVNDFYTDLVNTGMVVLGEREALRALEESFDAAGKAAAENGKNLDITTEKGRANQAALDGIVSSTFRAIEAQRENGATTAELSQTLAMGREEFIASAKAMGIKADAAGKLADQMNLIPSAVYIQFDSNLDDLGGKLYEIHELVQSTPDGQITINENSPDVIAGLRDLGYIVTTLPDGTIKVSETGTDEAGNKIDKTAGKKRTAKITAEAATATAETVLNNAARQRTATIVASVIGGPVGAAINAINRKDGGRLPGLDTGGRLPATGLGTDKILAVNAAGVPIARVDDREWVVNRRSSDKHDELLSMINRDDPRVDMMKQLVGLAGGGRVGWSQGQDKSLQHRAGTATARRKQAESDLKAAERAVSRLQNAYSKVGSKKADKARKAAAKRELDAAKQWAKNEKAAVARLKKAEDTAKDRLRDSKERTARLSDASFDLRRDVKRGTITDQFTSGSGMSVVDRLFEQAANKDLSKNQRGKLKSLGYKLESELLRLEKRSDKLTDSLTKARAKRDDLLSVRDSVASKLRDETSLSGLLSEHQATRYGKVTTAGMVQLGRAKVTKLKAFEQKLRQLGAKGVSGVLVQEIAEMGVDAGTEAANILLASPPNDLKALNQVYADVEKYSRWSGDRVTDALSGGMYRSGLFAANGLVAGLESQQKQVDSAFYKLGKSAEAAFKKSLGIKSPSRVMKAAGINVGEGAELGILSKVGDVKAAAEKLMSPPALTVPPSFEVARFAQAQAAPPQFTVIVENPWTGEQVEAKVRAVADQSVAAGQRAVAAGVRHSRG